MRAQEKNRHAARNTKEQKKAEERAQVVADLKRHCKGKHMLTYVPLLC